MGVIKNVDNELYKDWVTSSLLQFSEDNLNESLSCFNYLPLKKLPKEIEREKSAKRHGKIIN